MKLLVANPWMDLASLCVKGVGDYPTLQKELRPGLGMCGSSQIRTGASISSEKGLKFHPECLIWTDILSC